MANLTLRHKRSAAKGLISVPVPTSSSTFMIDQESRGRGQGTHENPPRFSGESLTPGNEYSSLFTSGLMPQLMPTPSPTLSSFPSPPKTQPPQGYQSGSYGSALSPTKRQHLAPPTSYSPTTPARRRRSSIIHTTPGTAAASPRMVKSGGTDNGVERALEGVMRNLRVAVTPNLKKNSYSGPQSRWSSSTEGTVDDDGTASEGFFKPRKSSDTTRSRTTIRSTKSTKSTKSKSRKSEDTDRMDLDLNIEVDVPPVPPVQPSARSQTPLTPGRSKRMMSGLVRRLGLTPKKGSKGHTAAMPIPEYLPPPPPLPLPLPIPQERIIPKKSSMSTLRSALTKKSSTTTLRSVRSTHASASHPQHPFMSSSSLAQTMDCGTPPPIPGLPQPRRDRFDYDDVEGCFPSTPRSSGRRTPKSSIGQPKLLPDVSPSHFLNEMPRRAPETPKRKSFDFGEGQQTPDPSKAGDGVITFEEEDLGDIVMFPSAPKPELCMDDNSMDVSQEIFTPPTQKENTQPFDSMVKALALNSPFEPDHSGGQASTPSLQAKAAQKQTSDWSLRPKRAFNIPPTRPPLGSPISLGINTPPPNGKSLRSLSKKKSATEIKAAPAVLGSRNLNAMGPPVAPSTEGRSGVKMSRKDPLGIMKRFKSSRPADSLGNENDMPFRSGAGDGWGTPLPLAFPTPRPSGESGRMAMPRKALDLGTVESYFDPALNTFGPSRPFDPDQRSRRAIPDFSAPPPPPSGHTSFDSAMSSGSASQTEIESPSMEHPRRFDDEPGVESWSDQQEQEAGSPEYHFQLDPTESRLAQEEYGFRSESRGTVRFDWGMKKGSTGSENGSISMTTGEGVEEWELERYLRDLEGEAA